jgi:8-oxo-dGTP pyrophosphatase MutT (NUDIX family)
MGEGKKEKVTREFSSGGVVFRKKGGKTFWLVTRSMASDLYPKQVWRLPKGWIDEGETPEEAALREIREEGGVEVKIVKKIETVKYFYIAPDKRKVLKFVTFYLTEWIRDLPEGFDGETSEIAWLLFEEAYDTLSFKGEKEVLKKGKELL